MKYTLGLPNILTVLAVSMLWSAVSHAQVLMLDFGPTVATGTNTVNSPYHTTNLSFSGSTWNVVQTADIAAGGLLYANGGTATGISLNLGATTAATTASSTLLLTATPSGNSALGASTNAGIYAGTSVGTDGIFTGGGGTTRAVGFQLSGLAAGTYEVYISARSTNTGAQTQTAFVGASATSGNFVLNGAGMTSETVTFASAGASTGAWLDNANYLTFTITLGVGDVLNVATLGGGGEGRGFLNAMQIVAVPEPSALALVSVGLTGLGILRRSRPRQSP